MASGIQGPTTPTAVSSAPAPAAAPSLFSRICSTALAVLNTIKDWTVSPLMNRVITPIADALGLSSVVSRVSTLFQSAFSKSE
jgi:hypothetical protein